jgi:hypothetical protein
MKEVVDTIWLYHDQPRTGVAHFDGRPHYYEREFDDAAQEYTDVYSLTPISDPIFGLVMEKWQIWLRWKAAFRANETTLETHPALPQERPRYDELDQAIQREIAANRSMVLRALGDFDRKGDRVEWTKLPDGSQ